MGSIRTILIAIVLLGARTALAQDARADMAQALEDQADAHPTAPQLPVKASARARKALDQTAFEKKGKAERNEHAADAQAAAARDSGQQIGQAAAQARAANAAAQAAAGQAAAQAAKDRASHATGGRPTGGKAPSSH
jgi:hypothetical protein